MKLLGVGSIALAIALIMTGCLSTGSSGPSDRPLYYGYGTGSTATGAIDAAKRDVLRQVVPDLIGTPSMSANKNTVESEIYSTKSLNAYFFLDSMEVLEQGRRESTYFYRLAIRVDLQSLARSLRAAGVYGGKVTPQSGEELALPDQSSASGGAGVASGGTQSSKAPADSSDGEAQKSTGGSAASTGADASDRAEEMSELSPEQKELVEEYVDSLTFMVYFSEEGNEDPFLRKTAVGMANGYLTEHSLQAIDLETVESIKKDQELVYEEQTGRSVSLIQWIAQKLNADVYVEIDSRTTGKTGDNRYYGQANITMKFFESSTGRLLSSVNYKSPETFSTSSELDAINNALQSSIYQVMPRALDQVRGYMRDFAANGIPHVLILQNTQDTRLMRSFVQDLERKVESVETESMSKEESRYRVRLIGEAEDLLDIVFDVADGIPGLAGIDLVMLRGRTLTFDTGL